MAKNEFTMAVKIRRSNMKWIERILKTHLPLYVRLRPSYYWVAIWAASDLSKGETHWRALRITIRQGIHYSKVIAVLKAGII